jgi:hypothetical protein
MEHNSLLHSVLCDSVAIPFYGNAFETDQREVYCRRQYNLVKGTKSYGGH